MFIASIPRNERQRGIKGTKAHSRFSQALDEAVILLHLVVQILYLPELCGLRELLLGFQVINSRRIGGILIHVDHSWSLGVSRPQCFTQEPLCRSSVAEGTRQKVRSCCPLNRPLGTITDTVL